MAEAMNRVWIIGGTSGIGQEVAQNFKVNQPGLDLWPTGEELDVRDDAGLVEWAYLMRPRHLIYSAGITTLDWSRDILEQDFLEILHVNVVGFANALRAMQVVWPGKQNDDVRGPSVVAIGSDAAWRPMRTSMAYCASKAALDMAVKVAARELAPLGWRVNCVAPGMTSDTGMTSYIDQRVPQVRGWSYEKAWEYEFAQSNIGRRVTPAEVAAVVHEVFRGPLAFNGAIVPVNGGR